MRNMTAVKLKLLTCTTYNFRRTFSLAAVACQKAAFHGEKKPCNFDFVVVGGGILGLATAREILRRHSYLKLALIEKECHLASHQTIRNPGLIHSGLLSKPDSECRKLCIRGSELIHQFCKKNSIPVRRAGKIILATNAKENEQLEHIISSAISQRICGAEILCGEYGIRRVEPFVTGLRALHCPNTASVDWKTVANELATDIRCRGGRILFPYPVEGFATNTSGDFCTRRNFPVCVFGHQWKINASHVVVCGGIFSDRLAVMTGCGKSPMNFPMRGHYLRLTHCAKHLVKGNVYTVPDPRFPYLGPNITRRADGCVCLGPNVIPASKREGYKIYDMSLKDMFEMVIYKGFWKTSPRHYIQGFKGVCKELHVNKNIKSYQRFLPTLMHSSVEKCPMVIVFPMPVNEKGRICNELCLEIAPPDAPCPEVSQRVLHCRTVPQPAATASMAIAEKIADKVETEFFSKSPRS